MKVAGRRKSTNIEDKRGKSLTIAQKARRLVEPFSFGNDFIKRDTTLSRQVSNWKPQATVSVTMRKKKK